MWSKGMLSGSSLLSSFSARDGRRGAVSRRRREAVRTIEGAEAAVIASDDAKALPKATFGDALFFVSDLCCLTCFP